MSGKAEAYKVARDSLGAFVRRDGERVLYTHRWAYAMEPTIRERVLSVREWTTEGLNGQPWNGEEVPLMAGAAGLYRGVDHAIQVNVLGAEEVSDTELPYPTPVTKGEVRYKNGEWQRLSKKHGWVRV